MSLPEWKREAMRDEENSCIFLVSGGGNFLLLKLLHSPRGVCWKEERMRPQGSPHRRLLLKAGFPVVSRTTPASLLPILCNVTLRRLATPAVFATSAL